MQHSTTHMLRQLCQEPNLKHRHLQQTQKTMNLCDEETGSFGKDGMCWLFIQWAGKTFLCIDIQLSTTTNITIFYVCLEL